MSGQLTATELAAQAEDAIHALIHHTRRHTGDLTSPDDAARLIANLAYLTGMLPQLLGQLADWLDHQHRHRCLRVDTDTLDTDQLVQELTDTLQQAIDLQRRAAHDLDNAHQHAAHLTGPTPQHSRGQNSCRSVGPSHLTKRTGDDEAAKDVVAGFLDAIGYDAYEVGPLAEGWRYQRDTAAYVQPYGGTRTDSEWPGRPVSEGG